MKTEYRLDVLSVVLSMILFISLLLDSSGLVPLLLTASIIVCMLAKINARQRNKMRCNCRDLHQSQFDGQEELRKEMAIRDQIDRRHAYLSELYDQEERSIERTIRYLTESKNKSEQK